MLQLCYFPAFPLRLPKDHLVFVNRGQMSPSSKMSRRLFECVPDSSSHCPAVLQSQTQNQPPHEYARALCGYGLP